MMGAGIGPVLRGDCTKASGSPLEGGGHPSASPGRAGEGPGNGETQMAQDTKSGGGRLSLFELALLVAVGVVGVVVAFAVLGFVVGLVWQVVKVAVVVALVVGLLWLLLGRRR